MNSDGSPICISQCP